MLVLERIRGSQGTELLRYFFKFVCALLLIHCTETWDTVNIFQLLIVFSWICIVVHIYSYICTGVFSGIFFRIMKWSAKKTKLSYTRPRNFLGARTLSFYGVAELPYINFPNSSTALHTTFIVSRHAYIYSRSFSTIVRLHCDLLEFHLIHSEFVSDRRFRRYQFTSISRTRRFIKTRFFILPYIPRL